jgi:hypothetical protein
MSVGLVVKLPASSINTLKGESETRRVNHGLDREREGGDIIIIIVVVVIIIIRGNKLYHSGSAQAVPACPGEGRLEARQSVR